MTNLVKADFIRCMLTSVMNFLMTASLSATNVRDDESF